MASYKVIFALILIIKLVINVVPSSAVRNAPLRGMNPSEPEIIFGSRIPGDRLLINKFIYVPARACFTVQDEERIVTPNGELITQIELISQKVSGPEARVQLINNGPGHTNAILKFCSKWNHGIHFILRVFGRYPKL